MARLIVERLIHSIFVILDRFAYYLAGRAKPLDIHLDVPRIPHEQLSDRRPGETSAAIQERVARARAIQATRFAGTALLTNADMGPKELRQHAALDDTTESLLGSAVRQMGLSAHMLSTGSNPNTGTLKLGLNRQRPMDNSLHQHVKYLYLCPTGDLSCSIKSKRSLGRSDASEVWHRALKVALACGPL